MKRLHRPILRAGAGGYGFIRSLNPAAWYRADTGVTVTGLGVSTWADQSGNGRDLLQGTDANRPPYLSYSGTKYLYLPGVAGNYASSPDSAIATGDIDIRAYLALDDWTPSAIQDVFSQWNSTTSRCVSFQVAIGGNLAGAISVDGSTVVNINAGAATGFTDGAAGWVRFTRASASGDCNFYKSTDGSTWTQVGTTQSSTAGALFNSTLELQIGALTASSRYLSGKVYRCALYKTIDGSTAFFDFNPDLDGSDQAATITSSATGEVWTINSSGGLKAQIVAMPSLLFDGTADYLRTNAFTLNQPETVYIVFKQVSWTSADMVFDGNAANSMALQQGGSTPQVQLNTDATAFVGPANGPAVGVYGVVTSVFNVAASQFQVNLDAATTGTLNATNAGAFTLGARGNGAAPANIQVLEVLVAAGAHDAPTRARVIQYLAGRHGIAL